MQRQVALYRGSGSEALKLAPKDVAVVQPGAALEEGRRAHKVRHIHPEILRRALADIRAEGLARAGKADFDPEDVVGPSVRELRKLMAGKAKTPKLRASADDFVEDYAEKIL